MVGFMEKDEALMHLATACVPVNPDPSILEMEWLAAKAKLGAPQANPGQPDIRPIPPEHHQYIALLAAQPWVAQALVHMPGASFQLVEIDPLLAFQHTISQDRSGFHCGGLGNPPSMEELLNVCLPQQQANEPVMLSADGKSLLVRAESLNIKTLKAGPIQPGFLGIQIGLSLPLLHVVRFNGKCYLHNGFHRALGARAAGATHVPCLFRDVNSHEEVGVNNAGATFSAELLESGNPPTLFHFTQGRAHNVQLRRAARYIHVSWSEFAMPVE